MDETMSKDDDRKRNNRQAYFDKKYAHPMFDLDRKREIFRKAAVEHELTKWRASLSPEERKRLKEKD